MRTELEAIPGTHEPGFVEHPLVEYHNPEVRRDLKEKGALGVRFYELGECWIITAREPSGVEGQLLWHLSISHTDRHPTWDEIKVARYRLLPLDLTFGMILPPPRYYVNVPQQNHVFHLYEILDPREPWTAF